MPRRGAWPTSDFRSGMIRHAQTNSRTLELEDPATRENPSCQVSLRSFEGVPPFIGSTPQYMIFPVLYVQAPWGISWKIRPARICWENVAQDYFIKLTQTEISSCSKNELERHLNAHRTPQPIVSSITTQNCKQPPVTSNVSVRPYRQGSMGQQRSYSGCCFLPSTS